VREFKDFNSNTNKRVLNLLESVSLKDSEICNIMTYTSQV